MTDLHDALMAGGGAVGRTAKFASVGDTHKGTIVAHTYRADLMPDGTQRTFADGKPRPDVLVVSIQTDEREDADDDGIRALWLKWKMKEAVVEAVKKSGGSFQVGGELAVKFSGEEKPTVRGNNPTKLYTASYRPPSPLAEDDLL